MFTKSCLAAGLALAACAGAQAHVVLEQKSAPAGGTTVEPVAQPGWTVETREAPLPAPVASHGRAITQAVSQVSWSGGPLMHDRYGEFTALVRLPPQPGRLHFRVLQECEQGQADWTETESRPGGGRPAAALEVAPAAGGARRHRGARRRFLLQLRLFPVEAVQ